MWCCLQEGLFEVSATTQASQSQPVTLLGSSFATANPATFSS